MSSFNFCSVNAFENVISILYIATKIVLYYCEIVCLHMLEQCFSINSNDEHICSGVFIRELKEIKIEIQLYMSQCNL